MGIRDASSGHIVLRLQEEGGGVGERSANKLAADVRIGKCPTAMVGCLSEVVPLLYYNIFHLGSLRLRMKVRIKHSCEWNALR